jgi:hypothetical protein
MLFQEKRTIQYPLKIADAIDLVGELYTTVSINIFEAIHNNNNNNNLLANK